MEGLHNKYPQYCIRNEFCIEAEGGELVLKNKQGVEFGRGPVDLFVSIGRYVSPHNLEAIDTILGEATPDEIVWHFLRLDDYAPLGP